MTRPYELEPLEDRPDVPPGVIVRREPEEVIEAVAGDLFLHAMNCVRAFGDFNLALSGGRTHVRLYQTLMLDPQFRSFPWKRTHLWVVSERATPVRDESASVLLRDLIAAHSDIPRDQFHPMSAAIGAGDYAERLRETLGWREPGHDRLDYVLLGLGEDGSTAGMPSSAAVPEEPLVHEIDHAGDRHVSLGVRAINGARFVAVVAMGRSKRAEVRRALAARTGPGAPDRPIDRIRPVGGELRWYLDREAFDGDA